MSHFKLRLFVKELEVIWQNEHNQVISANVENLKKLSCQEGRFQWLLKNSYCITSVVKTSGDLKMLSFIKYLEVIWHDEIQNKKKTEDVNNDCLKSFSLENATTSIPRNILITLIITPMAGIFFSIFELFWVIFRAVTGNAFF